MIRPMERCGCGKRVGVRLVYLRDDIIITVMFDIEGGEHITVSPPVDFERSRQQIEAGNYTTLSPGVVP